MAVSVISFFQPGCMGCSEQHPINREVSSSLRIPIEEIDAIKQPQYVKQYSLRVTPTTLVLVDGGIQERFEGVVHREQLESALKKYL